MDECDSLENCYIGNGIVGSNPTPSASLERWLSGLKRSPAKRVGDENPLEGSNPSLSAKRL